MGLPIIEIKIKDLIFNYVFYILLILKHKQYSDTDINTIQSD